ncbi:uncharacterized protein LOC131323272 isoform X1 [Rhododendron vialii]|uniref:uncharacterized protein LOC131323272 isoform X1 n=1 Tax=Rhododendron vialii TaxID=182163 RepID=UPI00265D9A59|nr:uncharacterized protein LOC131323272 isoform X1 [Rhododendron vialii]
MSECERNDPELKGLRHVDQLSENLNDNTSSGSLDAVFTQKEVDAAQVSGQMEQLPQSSETLEPEMARKIGKSNLRKSLAWDSAFFNSEGFLEPDELSSMIKGADKRGKHLLPGIEEDMQKSIDSISTLESESLTLESLEADFFEDIRASIQKSSKASNWTSSSKAAPGETDTQSTCSLKKVDASKNMLKLKPASKKQTIAMHEPGKLAKQSSGSQGTQASPYLPLASNGGVTSSVPKPMKVIGRPNPILSAPLKRASLDANKVKRENDKAKGSSVPCKVSLVSKVSGLGGPFRTAVPKPAPSSKSFSLNSVDGGKGISPVKSSRRRIDSKTVNPVSSSSTLKNPSKVPLKKKGQAQLTISKRASNASPASSFSEWSSVSSSSTSTANQRSNSSRVSIDTSSPCRSLDSDAPPAFENHEQISMHEHEVNPHSSRNQQKASMQSGVLNRPATGQPTGLRMPSPKLGFFDGVKPVDRTPKVSIQSHSGMPPRPKIGARISKPNGVSSQANNTKLQPTRSVTATGNLKLDSKKPASPVPSQKPLNASPKVSNVSGGVNKNHSISAKSHNKIVGESCLKAAKVVCEGLDGEKSRSPGVLKSEFNLEKQDDTKLKDSITPAEGNTYVSSHLNAEKIKLTENEDEHANFILQQLENELNSLCKRDEKEDAHFEDHVEGLSMHVGAMVSKQDVQKELVGKSVSQIDSGLLDSELPSSKELSCLSEMGESPSNLLGPTLISLSPTTSEINVSARTPLAIKNSFNEEDLPTRLSIGVVEKTSSIRSLESAQMDNS